MGINLPTYGRNETTVTAREAEVTTADFDGGLNLGASNAPGIGISTGNPNPKVEDEWTDNTQFGDARTPQLSMHIGGDGSQDGVLPPPSGDHAIQVAQYEVTPGVDDINDTASFVVAAAVAAPGQGMLAGNTGTVNRTDVTVQIGDRVWGTDTVA